MVIFQGISSYHMAKNDERDSRRFTADNMDLMIIIHQMLTSAIKNKISIYFHLMKTSSKWELAKHKILHIDTKAKANEMCSQ